MVNRYYLILLDVLYVAIIVALLLPNVSKDISFPVRIVLVILAVAQRAWQHVVHYRQTKKIY